MVQPFIDIFHDTSTLWCLGTYFKQIIDFVNDYYQNGADKTKF